MLAVQKDLDISGFIYTFSEHLPKSDEIGKNPRTSLSRIGRKIEL